MNKQSILRRMTACATLAMLFGTAVAQNATGSAATGSMSGNSSATAGAAGTSAGSGSGSAGATSKVASADQKMMRDIAHSNISEVAAGKLALEKSQSADVKAYAQKMIDDHTKAQQELQTLADSKGVKLPTDPDAKHKALVKVMSALKGETFDKRYLKQGGINDHENTHKLLTRVQDKARDQDLKAYAAKTIVVVDQHLALAKDTGARHGMGNAKASMRGAPSDNGTVGSRTGGATSSSGGSGAGAAGGGAGSSGALGGTGAGAMGSGGSPAGTGAGSTPGAATGGTMGGPSR